MAKRTQYMVGQQVEVLRIDFEIPGFPKVWQSGVVESVKPTSQKGVVDVHVALTAGGWSPQRVGPRGGNDQIRPVWDAALAEEVFQDVDNWAKGTGR